MPVTLPSTYQNATARIADVTQQMLDLFNVVQQLNGVTGTGIGYATGQGAGGAVSQLTDRTTAVTLNKLTGQITGQATSLAASTSVSFTVNNNLVASTDTVLLSLASGSTANTSVFVVSAVTNGTFIIRIANINTATADTVAPVINFTVIKGSNT